MCNYFDTSLFLFKLQSILYTQVSDLELKPFEHTL